MIFKSLTDYLVCLAVRGMLCAIQAVRLETCARVSRLLAKLFTDYIPLRRSVVTQNLQLAYPQLTPHEIRRITRRMWEHLFLLVCEVAHAPRKIHDSNWRQRVKIFGRREIVDYLLQPRPLVIVSSHFGNFETAGYMLGILGFRNYTIARTLDNPYLNRYLNAFRESKGQYILPKQGSAAAAEAVLAAGETLVLLGDQHAGPTGCWVDFFGQKASCHKAVALFTLMQGAPLAVAFMRRLSEPLRFELGITGVADPLRGGPELEGVRALTEWYNRHLENIIRTAPEQYWWVHRRWKETPRKRPARTTRSDREASSLQPLAGPHGGAPAPEMESPHPAARQ